MTLKTEAGEERSVERLAAGVLMVGFPSTSVPAETRRLVEAGVHNFILFARNLGNREAVRSLTRELRSAAGEDALVAIDHEGGRVMRLKEAATPWPSAMACGATGDPGLIEHASRVSASELAALGINLNFAPVGDVLADHRNPVLGTRCFSDDPRVTADFVLASVRGHRSIPVASTVKHFPGHGHTPVDSHVDLPRIDRTPEELRAADMLPFAAAAEADVDCVMISHAWYSALDAEVTPASTSAPVMQLARHDLRYEGVIVTDCMEMGAIQHSMTSAEAVVRAIVAGADLAIVSNRWDRQREAIDALAAAVQHGRLSTERLQEANRRLNRLRERVAGHCPPWSDEGPMLATEIARRAVTLVHDTQHILPVRDSTVGVISFAGAATQVEDGESHTILGAMARRHVERVVEATSDDGIDAALQQLEGVDAVLVGTARATQDPVQVETVRALLHAQKRVIVIGLRDPFDLLAFPDVPCFLAAYGEGMPEVEAALDVLVGRLEPSGTLPVAIPGLYPRGHGLRTLVG